MQKKKEYGFENFSLSLFRGFSRGGPLLQPCLLVASSKASTHGRIGDTGYNAPHPNQCVRSMFRRKEMHLARTVRAWSLSLQATLAMVALRLPDSLPACVSVITAGGCDRRRLSESRLMPTLVRGSRRESIGCRFLGFRYCVHDVGAWSQRRARIRQVHPDSDRCNGSTESPVDSIRVDRWREKVE